MNPRNASANQFQKSCLTKIALMFFSSVFVCGALMAETVQAADLEWGGLYRFEGVLVDNPEMSKPSSVKTYMLHHLILQPKINVADGMTIFGRFDVLSSGFGVNSQAGAFIGQGVGVTPSSGIDSSNVLSKNQAMAGLEVSEIYMSWAQEFGQLIVGRAPLNFGLGAWFNSGRGSFDHYLTTLDMIGYKIFTGNLFVMPILGKVNEGAIDRDDDVTDYMVHAQYDNPETELSIGVLYEMRQSGVNDYPVGTDYTGGSGSVLSGNYKHSYIGIYTSQKLKEFTVAFELGALSGDTGVKTAGNQKVKIDGMGVALEVSWLPEDSKWSSIIRAGYASGDDPASSGTNEGFTFHRNYRVAQLLFSHPLGQRDFLRTGLIRDTTVSGSSQIDTEAISNAIYVAPAFQYKTNERWAYGGTFATGILNTDPIVGSNTASDLGYEIDLNLTWTPFDRFAWITELGFLLPGEAWKAGSAGLDNKLVYGITTKAAIRF